MIHINQNAFTPAPDWIQRATQLTQALMLQDPAGRSTFINANRDRTWADPTLITSLRAVVGNKCWYSEVPLEGADPNVDHFRPKGAVSEIDSELKPTSAKAPGYWWLAFEYQNYRLAAMHANQRRVDEDTQGGKWDYFPVRGARAQEGTAWGAILEDILALDPCSPSDVALLWFDPNGTPGISSWRGKVNSEADKERVKVTIWLYHLDKSEINTKRAAFLDDIRKDLLKANAFYQLWKAPGNLNLTAKEGFDQKVAEIRAKLADVSPFSGAKRCAVRTAIADYQWIEECHIV